MDHEDTPPLAHPSPPDSLSPPAMNTAPPTMSKKRKFIGGQTPEPSTVTSSKRKRGNNIIETWDEASRRDDAMMQARLDASTQVRLRELELKAQEKREEREMAERKSLRKYVLQAQNQKYMLQIQLLRMQLQVGQSKSGSSSSALGLDGLDTSSMDGLIDPLLLGVGSPGSASFSNTPPSSASPYIFGNDLPHSEVLNLADTQTFNATQ